MCSVWARRGVQAAVTRMVAVCRGLSFLVPSRRSTAERIYSWPVQCKRCIKFFQIFEPSGYYLHGIGKLAWMVTKRVPFWQYTRLCWPSSILEFGYPSRLQKKREYAFQMSLAFEGGRRPRHGQNFHEKKVQAVDARRCRTQESSFNRSPCRLRHVYDNAISR